MNAVFRDFPQPLHGKAGILSNSPFPIFVPFTATESTHLAKRCYIGMGSITHTVVQLILNETDALQIKEKEGAIYES
jgi:hypothetical protein